MREINRYVFATKHFVPHVKGKAMPECFLQYFYWHSFYRMAQCI
jgi:hypothetical protein